VISRLLIRDFQSHTDTELLFSPQVNVIVGRNMSGKSAILRALRLVCYNKPDGSSFVTWDAKNAIIEITYGEHTIRRVKGTQNVYDVDGSTFSGFGRGVPEEVANVLGFTSVQVDRNVYELNFDHPHKAPFFISETDATKGKLFSKLGEQVLGGLVLLDKSIRVANASCRKLTTEQQVLVTQIAAVEQSLTAFAPLVGSKQALSECTKMLANAGELEEGLADLVGLQDELQTCDQRIAYLTRRLDVDVSPVSALIVTVNALSAEVAELVRLREEYVQLASDIQRLEMSTTALKGIPEGKVKKIRQAFTELDMLRNMQSSLETNSQNVTVAESNQRELQGVLVTVLEEYKSLLTAAKKCPLCLRPVEKHDLDLILEELVEHDTGTDTKESRADSD